MVVYLKFRRYLDFYFGDFYIHRTLEHLDWNTFGLGTVEYPYQTFVLQFNYNAVSFIFAWVLFVELHFHPQERGYPPR